jgi:hypothetical protein
LHAVRTPRQSNEREEGKVNGKESEEAREESPEKSPNDGEVVRPVTNLFKKGASMKSRCLLFLYAAYPVCPVAHPFRGEAVSLFVSFFSPFLSFLLALPPRLCVSASLRYPFLLFLVPFPSILPALRDPRSVSSVLPFLLRGSELQLRHKILQEKGL